MAPGINQAQPLLGSFEELQKNEGQIVSFFGCLESNYDLPHCPLVFLLNDQSKVFIGKNRSAVTAARQSDFVIITGRAKAANPQFDSAAYASQSWGNLHLKGRVQNPDSVIRSMPFFESIDTIIPLQPVYGLKDLPAGENQRILCIGKMGADSMLVLASDGKKIRITRFAGSSLPPKSSGEYVALYGTLAGNATTGYTLVQASLVWDFPVCRNAADFRKYAGREVVLEGKYRTLELGKPVDTRLPVIRLKDGTLVYIDQGKDLVDGRSGKIKVLTTISFLSPKPFYVSNEVWSPGLPNVADRIRCVIDP